jgi:FG-GAP-like repeat/Bacterial pre-peptidase C-terminal domain/FG-GAP repeat
MPNLINPTGSSLTAPIQLAGVTGTNTQKWRLDSTTHPTDIYSFTTTSASNLNIALKDLTGNARVRLVTANNLDVPITGAGNAINTNNGATLSESIIINNTGLVPGLAAGTYYVEVSLSGATSADYSLSVLTSLTGNLTNVFWRNEGNPQYSTASWQMDGTRSVQASYSPNIGPDWKVVGSGDFNGDGTDDLVWVNKGTSAEKGQLAIWLTDGFNYVQLNEPRGTALVSVAGQTAPFVIPDGWEIKAVADFSGDGKSDLLWYNTVTGDGAVWLMDGSFNTEATLLPNVSGWTIEAVADFDGPDANGFSKADIFWRNAATGQAAIWLMNGVASGPGTDYIGDPGANWQIVGTGDFNNDKKADFVWRNKVTGEDAIWLMNGIARLGTALLPIADLTWSITGLGDTNGDGKTDLVWRNSVTNAVAVWVMNGLSAQSTGFLPAAVDASWQFSVKNQNANFQLKNNQKALVDLNSDGKVDLFWRNFGTKEVAAWTLDGTQIGAGGSGYVTEGGAKVSLGTEWQNVAFLERKLKQVAQSTAGKSRATAFDLGTIIGDGGASYVDNVGSATNLTDDYKFTVNSDYLVTLGAVNPIAGGAAPLVSPKLYRVGGTLLLPTYTLTTLTAGVPIAAGTYIIEVTPTGTGAVDYKLNLTAAEAVVELSGAPTGGFSVAYPTGTTAITLADVGNGATPITTPITVNYKVQNTGNYSAANVQVSFYLSRAADGSINPTDTTNDRKLGQTVIVAIPAGAANAVSGSVILQLPAGDDLFWDRDRTYEIGMVVNPTNEPTYTPKKETILTDNFNQAQGQDKSTLPIINVQLPDLTGDAVSVGASVVKGAPTTVGYTVANIGKKGTANLAPNIPVSFYFLTGTPIAASAFNATTATLLQTLTLDNLISPLGKLGSATASFTGSTQLTIPTTIAESSGYIVMVVDGPGNAINEGVEDNNVFVGTTFSLV